MGRFRVLVAFMLSSFMLLAGVLVAMPVDRAAADGLELGPDGYFSTLSAGEMPMRSIASEGNAHKVLFGRSGLLANAAKVVEPGDADNAQVDGKYVVLGKGANASKNRSPAQSSNASWATSATTSLVSNEVLLWADDVVTSPFTFIAGTSCTVYLCNTFDAGSADSDGKASYESQVAKVSQLLGSNTYYSDVELSQMGAASQLNAVCTNASNCADGFDAAPPSGQQDSVGSYRVFPLSIGDMAEYFNANDGYEFGDNAKRRCSGGYCNNGVSGSWLRSARWNNALQGTHVSDVGFVGYSGVLVQSMGLRPAVRLNLEHLLLSANHSDQSQVLGASDLLRLTFVDASKALVNPVVTSAAGELVVSAGSNPLSSGFGWKAVDPSAVDGSVVASGFAADGHIDASVFPLNKVLDFYYWGQENGSATEGWSNRATVPVRVTIRNGKEYVPPSYGIELTGTTAGGLTAYRIGEYAESVFDHTGALKSVKLSTPADPVKASILAAAGVAGGSGVDVDNPMGWVASQWLGYPTDPLSDDVTSAFSPFAGKLQLFARALAAKSDAELGGVKGSLPAGTFASLATETLSVSGPGLYLIVDSSGASLPIIVGTKVFNEDLDDGDGRFVDFVDAGVKGKPRLGQAVLKTTVTDVAKRVVNDAGMDGFDVGSEVEFEVALQVPDLSGFSSVSYAAYEFAVADVAEAGLSLPAASGVKVLVDVPLPDTEVTAQVSVGRTTTTNPGDTLTVAGLKAVFAEDAGGRVANKATLPAGSLMRIRYMAVLNTNASWSAPGGGALDPNSNTATLTRSKSDGNPETKTATANAYSFKLDLVKVDKDDVSKPLGDAKFEVSRDGQALKFVKLSDGVYRLDAAGTAEVTTHTDGTLSLQGVEARELSFKEIMAPSGYFTVSDFMVEVVPVWDADASEVTVASYRTGGTDLAFVSQDGRSVVVADPSKSLANLPYTGGIGILILLIVGGLFLMVAVRPYYLSHRAEATANILM
ncbi:MAG: isopeptide-forming domain-containing fimbrial protein [Bifidobacterium crudilactis]|jgi:fimbrial isopeptide formation D2 family protein|nr:isopeptide-forming domain-containing fimbrial protein [Bifidobacterium crudilactis]